MILSTRIFSGLLFSSPRALIRISLSVDRCHQAEWEIKYCPAEQHSQAHRNIAANPQEYGGAPWTSSKCCQSPPSLRRHPVLAFSPLLSHLFTLLPASICWMASQINHLYLSPCLRTCSGFPNQDNPQWMEVKGMANSQLGCVQCLPLAV